MTLPDRLLMVVDADEFDCKRIAVDAAKIARSDAPKMTGAMSQQIFPISGTGWAGLRWLDPVTWYQEMGISGFTMRKLAGKTIPMWIDDPTGEERRKNPESKTRTTASGRTQVLIFRRAAQPGQRKRVRRNGVWANVPASYPGAPGRIANREAAAPWTTEGRVAGAIARRNIGVRWYHPGLEARLFMHHALEMAALRISREHGPVFPADAELRLVA